MRGNRQVAGALRGTALEGASAEQERLVAIWRRLKGDRELPSWDRFDPGEIRTLLPYVLVVELVGAPVRFKVRLYGTAVAALRGGDLTGHYLDEPGALPPGLWPQFRATYHEAIEVRTPVSRLVSYRRPPDEIEEWQHLRVILPFARSGGSACEILMVAIIPAGGNRMDRRADGSP